MALKISIGNNTPMQRFMRNVQHGLTQTKLSARDKKYAIQAKKFWKNEVSEPHIQISMYEGTGND
jgi:hypothetical protein